MLANPVHMHWDSRGRLWVACSWAYPQLKPGEVADDKIIILEDTDDDGVADQSTVFADGLYLPTGIELADGGCYVAQSPDVFFLKDTDGDDVADVKQLALTGFGIEDSHHSISAWRRGPGGWIYFRRASFCTHKSKRSTASCGISTEGSISSIRERKSCGCSAAARAAIPGGMSSIVGGNPSW